MVDNGTLGNIHAVEASCLDPQDKNGETQHALEWYRL